ncbi:MAG: ribonuclease PH [Candidatus Hydrogenedentes bacterium]|jgi:ribonuclease PH|nr:ribonuclease PH [Candidatus Hydrogenedentota bacterium]
MKTESRQGTRSDGRDPNALRPVTIMRGFTKTTPGSVLVAFGDTRVLCTASFEEKPPPWLRGQNKGWITAEYAMLPGAGHERIHRNHTKQGRAQEISRLIGRSLRAVTDLNAMGECMLIVDCDVLQADGSTRCASVTGAWIAVHDAFQYSVQSGYLQEMPLIGQCAAVSVGIVEEEAMLDLCYEEDTKAAVDLNLVMNESGNLIEIQGTAEGKAFSQEQLSRMLALGTQGIQEIISIQKASVAHER